jgi:hypothetical protein
MRTGTHHTPETRLTIRLKRLEKSMPSAEFARFKASNGALKWCPMCKHLLPVSEFYKNRRTWDGLFDRCKECASALAQAHHRKRGEDPEYREWRRKRTAEWREVAKADGRLSALNKKYDLKKYGITVEQFEAMLAAQRYRCAICKGRLKGDKGTHVDHDHADGRVRGMLCGKCNVALGGFQDDIAILRSAVKYLERDRRLNASISPEGPKEASLWDSVVTTQGDAA